MATPNLRLLVAAALAVVLVACDDYGAGDRGTPRPEPTAGPTSTPPPAGDPPPTTAGDGGTSGGSGRAGGAGGGPVAFGGGPVLGADPETGAGFGAWLLEASPLDVAQNGDRFDTGCGQLATCTPGAPPLRYLVAVGQGGLPLRIEAYDAVQLAYGAFCQDGQPSPDELRLLDALDDGVPAADGTPDPVPVGWYDDALIRYAAGPPAGGPAPEFCPGDRVAGTAPLTFEVLDPRGVVRCARQFGAFAPDPLLTHLLDARRGRVDPADDDDPGGITPAEAYHRWYPVCELPAELVVPGNYAIIVRTDLPAPGRPLAGQSENGFSLRVGTGGAPAALFAPGAITLTTSTSTPFSLPLLGPQTGRAVLELFDLEGATARLVDDGGRALGPDEACERRAADGAGVPGVAEASCTTDGLDPGDGGVIDLGADLDVTGPLGALLVDVEGLTTTGEAFTVTSLSGGGGGPASPL